MHDDSWIWIAIGVALDGAQVASSALGPSDLMALATQFLTYLFLLLFGAVVSAPVQHFSNEALLRNTRRAHDALVARNEELRVEAMVAQALLEQATETIEQATITIEAARRAHDMMLQRALAAELKLAAIKAEREVDSQAASRWRQLLKKLRPRD
jgi:hypothetical protein